jgi:hypothetical protein
MSNYKMSEWFAGKLYSDDNYNNGTTITDDQGVILLTGGKYTILAAKKAINSHDALVSRVAEIEAVLKSISSFAGSLPDQFPEHLEDEISLIHNEAIEKIYDMTLEALEDKS